MPKIKTTTNTTKSVPTKLKKNQKKKGDDDVDSDRLVVMTQKFDYDQDKIDEIFDDPVYDSESDISDNKVDNVGDVDNVINQRYKSTNSKDEIPLVEKYRPRKLDEIVQQDEVIKVLKNTLETGEMPHLLFHGEPGTGKTSAILALVMQLYGPNIINDRVIELNASDDRGIGTVRNTIISFTKMAIGSKDPKYPCPDFKIVILDEADAMTPEAQEALRKVMEKKCSITRFCFICNYINKIIEPIASRCTQFRFKPLDRQAVINKILTIAKTENVNVDENCAGTIHEVSEGDLRRAIMILQNTKYLTGNKHEEKITSNDIIKFTGGVENKHIKNFWKIITTGGCNDIRNLAIFLQRQGYQVRYILNHLKKCITDSKLNDVQKAKISIEMCRTDKFLTEGSDEYLQILNILVYTNIVSKQG